MPKQVRHKTKYAGVYLVENSDKSKSFYIRYRKAGEKRLIEEKAGNSAPPDLMTAAKANQLRADRIAGRTATNTEQREQTKWSIAKIWDEYIQDKGAGLRGFKPDRARFNNYIRTNIGKKSPSELTTLDLDRIRKKMTGLSPQTQRHVLALVKRLVLWAVKKGLIDMPSTKKLRFDLPKVDNEVTEDLTDAQVDALLAALDEEPNQSLADTMRLALVSGMRRSEIYSLQWVDVNMERGSVTIRNPKGGKTTTLPLNESALEIIKRQPRRGVWVFCNHDGRQYGTSNEYKTLRRIREKAGLPKSFRPMHGLRHAFASRLAASGVDLYVVQKLLTHKSQAMTQRYSHLRDEALRNGAEVGGKVLPLRPAANG